MLLNVIHRSLRILNYGVAFLRKRVFSEYCVRFIPSTPKRTRETIVCIHTMANVVARF